MVKLNDSSSAADAASRATRRAHLVQQIEALGGFVPAPGPGDVTELELDFLQRILAIETGPYVSNREWLEREGSVFVPLTELPAGSVGVELMRLVNALARARVFINYTDHLSDAELYERLWEEVLPDELPDLPRTEAEGFHWDFSDGGGEPNAWLAYYASDEERERWRTEFPEIIIPPRCRPPYARDHLLPKRD
jgi:hypothetical protein